MLAWLKNPLIDTKLHVWPTSMRGHTRKGVDAARHQVGVEFCVFIENLNEYEK